MTYFIVWIVCGIISSIIASQKGRSGCGWFILGVLLGPLGFILALVVSEDKQEVERNQISSKNMKKCPYCAEIIKNEATVCRYCNKDLPEVEKIVHEPGKIYNLSINSDDSVFCPICNTKLILDRGELQEQRFFCEKCKSDIQFSCNK